MVNGVSEPLPDLKQLAGHVLYGWKTGRTHEFKSYLNKEFYLRDKTKGGHTAYSMRPRTTRFPESWSDQQIIDAMVEVLETGKYTKFEGEERAVEGEVNGVTITVKYSLIDGQAVQVYGYPEYDEKNGTSRVNRRGNVVKK